MRCGSRGPYNTLVALDPFPGGDKWETQKDGTRTCSFCGSLHEDDFIDILEHYIAGDADYHYDPSIKTYKRYAHRPGVRAADDGGIKFYAWHVVNITTKDRLADLDKQARAKHDEWMRQRFSARDRVAGA